MEISISHVHNPLHVKSIIAMITCPSLCFAQVLLISIPDTTIDLAPFTYLLLWKMPIFYPNTKVHALFDMLLLLFLSKNLTNNYAHSLSISFMLSITCFNPTSPF